MEEKPKTCLINMRVDSEFKKKLHKISKKTGISITFMTRTAIKEYLERNNFYVSDDYGDNKAEAQ